MASGGAIHLADPGIRYTQAYELLFGLGIATWASGILLPEPRILGLGRFRSFLARIDGTVCAHWALVPCWGAIGPLLFSLVLTLASAVSCRVPGLPLGFTTDCPPALLQPLTLGTQAPVTVMAGLLGGLVGGLVRPGPPRPPRVRTPSIAAVLERDDGSVSMWSPRSPQDSGGPYARLVVAASCCRTGLWPGWGGELWLLEDGVLHRRLGLWTCLARSFGNHMGTVDEPRGPEDIPATGRPRRPICHIHRQDVVRARFRPGIPRSGLRSRLRLTLRDGTRTTLTWDRTDYASARVEGTLRDWLGEGFTLE